MRTFLAMLGALSLRERRCLAAAAALFLIGAMGKTALAIATNSVLEPVRGGSYREGVVGQPVTLNPILSTNPVEQELAMLLFSPLRDLLQNLESDPALKTYTLKLKEGLVWSDGEPLTSDDVIFTIETVQNPEAASPYAPSWRGVAAERVSALQVKISLPSPYVFFEENLARLPVIPKHIFGAVPVQNARFSAYNLEPVGSGPYRVDGFKTRRDGFITEYRLAPNEQFAGDPPFVTRFTFVFFENLGEAADAFRKRIIQGFGFTPPLRGTSALFPHTVTETLSLPRYYAVFLNSINNTALKDRELRAALSAAIDRERIVREVFQGEAVVVHGPEGGDPRVVPAPYNFEEALSRLAPLEPEKLTLTLLTPDATLLRAAAERIRDDWRAAGVVSTTVVALDAEELLNDVIQTRNYEAVLFGNALLIPEDLFPFWHSSERFPPGLNLSLYENRAVDRLLEATRETRDSTGREENYREAKRLIAEDAPAIFLFALPYYYIHTESLAGFDAAHAAVPADRFRHVERWNVIQVRVVR